MDIGGGVSSRAYKQWEAAYARYLSRCIITDYCVRRLTVTERTNHMMTVGYVPLRADATIGEPTIDFKFRNDYEYPVYIEAYL